MGFYLRKSIRVGPFRFNLSKSGIGVSAGIRGLRFGTSPRGNYVHMGVGMLQYRETLSDRARPRGGIQPPAEVPNHSHEPLREIDSGTVLRMTDSTSANLLSEMNSKRRKLRLWPLAAGVCLLTLILSLASHASLWIILMIVLLASGGIFWTYQWDQLRKTTVLFYDFDSPMEHAFDTLHVAADQLASCAGIWHIEAHGAVYDQKYHAGAASLVRRTPIRVSKGLPPYVKSNIASIAVPVGRETLYFFPDRVLVFAPNGVGAVSYESLNFDLSTTRFIEDWRAPSDATVVGQTWQYVNKSGGPDLRFKANRQLPVCLYQEVRLTSGSGLNELIQFSRVNVAEHFRDSVLQLVARASPAAPREVHRGIPDARVVTLYGNDQPRLRALSSAIASGEAALDTEIRRLGKLERKHRIQSAYELFGDIAPGVPWILAALTGGGLCIIATLSEQSLVALLGTSIAGFSLSLMMLLAIQRWITRNPSPDEVVRFMSESKRRIDELQSHLESARTEYAAIDRESNGSTN